MIFPPTFLILRVVDKLDRYSPVRYTYDECERCAGKGFLRVDAGRLRRA